MHIISIVGPTAVGKSAVALMVARALLAEKAVAGVDIISADSRQVFKGLEIISGADLPDGCEVVNNTALFPYRYFGFAKEHIWLHGSSIIEPSQAWSLAHFHQLAQQVIASAQQLHHLVIVVGGTGLYQSQLLQPKIGGLFPPLPDIRAKATNLSVSELQQWLKQLNPAKLEVLNESDRANPRRLVRAVERELGQSDTNQEKPAVTTHSQSFFGLQVNKEVLAQRIQMRVEQRLAAGAVQEALRLEASLEEMSLSILKLPIHSTCGLREVLAYAHGDLDAQQCITLWTQREVSYAKRQATWWKKYSDVKWFNRIETDCSEQLLAAVRASFSRSQEAEILL